MRLRQLNIILLFLLLSIQLIAQTWTVPEDKKAKVAPFKFSKETETKGEPLFLKNCQSCHGYPGKNNFAKLTPPPGDPASDIFQKQTDGEMFYKITTGKIPMPSFQNILSEEERWNIISFFRSFNKNYVQPKPEVKKTNAENNISLYISYLPWRHQVKVLATKLTKGHIIFAKGIDINLFVKRYFGNMKVDSTKTTNNTGEATFDFPTDLPGDYLGYLDLIAKVNESDNNNEAESRVKLMIGKPTKVGSLLNTRGWWLVRGKAPVWLILTYSLSVIVVWSFIIYIISQFLKIRKLNN